MSKRGRRNVGFTKPPEPSFITQMKQQIGYKEGPTVDTKRENLDAAGDDLDERFVDDEAPTVVVLRDGDLSAEEVAREKALQEPTTPAGKAEEPEETGGRILFRKPAKRDATGEASSAVQRDEDKPAKKKSKPPKQNTKLLSFQQDDDEDQD
ncbi:hypothetical protein B566_EDAN011961 [Ephemera danica]|nr:hypothetical protein B566_EDAN011961 [Ephemera danica]